MKTATHNRVASDSMLLSFVRVISILVSIATTKILSIALDLNEYGAYSQVNVVSTIATSFLLLGLVDALNYFYNNQGEGYQGDARITIVHTVYAIELVLGTLSGIIMIFSRGVISSYFKNDIVSVFLPLVAFRPLVDNLLHFYQVLYVSSGKARLIAIRNLVISLLKLAATYVTTVCINSLQMTFICIFVLDVMQLAVMKVWFAKEVFTVNPLRGRISYVKPIMQFGFPMAVYAMTSMLARAVDKLVIGRLADVSTFAIYSNCSKVLPFDIVPTSFAVVLVPFIMRYVSAQEYSKAVGLFRNYLKVGYYSVWTLGVAVLITANQAISFLYTDEYVVGNSVFKIYVLDSMLRFANMHLILTSAGETKKLMKYSIVSLILNIVLSIVFYNWMGMIGPAAATLITSLIYAFQVVNESRNILQVKWGDVFELKGLGIFSVSLVSAGLICGWINQYMLSLGINEYLTMFTSAGLCVIVTILINLKDIKKTLVTINSQK